jgi:hypothetical protein
MIGIRLRNSDLGTGYDQKHAALGMQHTDGLYKIGIHLTEPSFEG